MISWYVHVVILDMYKLVTTIMCVYCIVYKLFVYTISDLVFCTNVIFVNKTSRSKKPKPNLNTSGKILQIQYTFFLSRNDPSQIQNRLHKYNFVCMCFCVSWIFSGFKTKPWNPSLELIHYGTTLHHLLHRISCMFFIMQRNLK